MTGMTDVIQDGLDWLFECCCGARIRGFGSEAEAQTAADRHELDYHE